MSPIEIVTHIVGHPSVVANILPFALNIEEVPEDGPTSSFLATLDERTQVLVRGSRFYMTGGLAEPSDYSHKALEAALSQ